MNIFCYVRVGGGQLIQVSLGGDNKMVKEWLTENVNTNCNRCVAVVIGRDPPM